MDAGHTLALREMAIRYEATESPGVGLCAFKLRDGVLMPQNEMRSRVREKQLADTVAMLDTLRKNTRELHKLVKKRAKFDCCL